MGKKEIQSTCPFIQNKAACENLVKRRFIVAPGFEIYGGASGLFDYGPVGCAIKVKLEQKWREHFITYDGLYEVSTTNLTPHGVFKASGHVDRFTDLMVHDEKTGDAYRADKLIEGFVDSVLDKSLKPKTHSAYKVDESKLKSIQTMAGSYNNKEVDDCITDLEIKSATGNPLTKSVPFNLMFQTQFGPKASADTSSIAYLRPETAQGIFVNFKRLYEQNYNKLPFGGAQIGTGFRNEIAPRNGLLRVREFSMAEIEYFVDPLEKKKYKKFSQVSGLKLKLYSRKEQEDGLEAREVSLREAIDTELIENETIGYFMGRTYLFMISVGIQPEYIRFREHLANEMAHYSTCCWDCEVYCAYGWMECVGHADRSAYDLIQHTKATGIPLTVARPVKPPRLEDYVKITINAKEFGKKFGAKFQIVKDYIENLSDERKLEVQAILTDKGTCELENGFVLQKSDIQLEKDIRKIHEDIFVPNTIEPSFGIGRIVHMILEHTFRSRNIEGQADRNYLKLPVYLAPFHCVLLPISANEKFDCLLEELHTSLACSGFSCKIDSSASNIGKRYARTDEIGVPFAITIDFDSVNDDTVTIRERDSMQQIRVHKSEVIDYISKFVLDIKHWEETVTRLGNIKVEEN